MTNYNTNGLGLIGPQPEHSEFLFESLHKNKFAWDGSDTGTGKTYSTCAILHNLRGKKFVIICPKLGIPKWSGVLKKFGLHAEFILNYEVIARGNLKKIYRYHERGVSPSGIKWSDVPYFLRGEWKIPKDWIVVMDESHRTKGVESLNSGLVFDLKNQGYTVLMLSATQAMTPMDMRAFGYIADMHKGMHHTPGRGQNNGMNIFKTFCTDAGAEFTGSFGAMYFDSSDPESRQKLYTVVHKYLFEDKKMAHRMRREDFGDLFRTNSVEATSYDMGENSRKIRGVYDDMQRELARLQERVDNYSQHILAIITAARRKVELLKVPSLCEITEDLWDEGKTILIFVNYTDTIDALYARLSKKFGEQWIGKIYGEQTVKQRWNDINAVQADRKRIMLINIAAGCELIDLNDITGSYPRAALINPGYRAISIVQSIGRADRAGTLTDIFTNLVLASGTIEDSVGAKFNSKKGHLDILLDGDLIPDGVAFNVGNIMKGHNV
jgi:Helicase conserved C-terminal domain